MMLSLERKITKHGMKRKFFQKKGRNVKGGFRLLF